VHWLQVEVQGLKVGGGKIGERWLEMYYSRNAKGTFLDRTPEISPLLKGVNSLREIWSDVPVMIQSIIDVGLSVIEMRRRSERRNLFC